MFSHSLVVKKLVKSFRWFWFTEWTVFPQAPSFGVRDSIHSCCPWLFTVGFCILVRTSVKERSASLTRLPVRVIFNLLTKPLRRRLCLPLHCSSKWHWLLHVTGKGFCSCLHNFWISTWPYFEYSLIFHFLLWWKRQFKSALWVTNSTFLDNF